MKYHYTVEVELTATQTVEVEVEAENEREAQRLAERQAEPDKWDWSMEDADAHMATCHGPVTPAPPPVHPGQATIQGWVKAQENEARTVMGSPIEVGRGKS